MSAIDWKNGDRVVAFSHGPIAVHRDLCGSVVVTQLEVDGETAVVMIPKEQVETVVKAMLKAADISAQPA